MRTLRLVACLTLPSALLCFAMPALASVAFPEALRKELELAEAPPPAPGCLVCHKTDAGGLKTVTKPFGRTLMGLGATASSVPALLGALGAAEQENADSDGDGIPDVTELRELTDPNVAAVAPGEEPPPPVEEVPLPETGCSVAVAFAEREPPPAHAWLPLLALVALAARRRTR